MSNNLRWAGASIGWMPADSEYFTGTPDAADVEIAKRLRKAIARKLDRKPKSKTSPAGVKKAEDY